MAARTDIDLKYICSMRLAVVGSAEFGHQTRLYDLWSQEHENRALHIFAYHPVEQLEGESSLPGRFVRVQELYCGVHRVMITNKYY